MTVMARDGLAGASTRAIAEAAGVNKAMLHYSFADKDALLMAVLAHILLDVRRTLEAAAAQAPAAPAARLKALMQAYWRHVQATPTLQRVQYELTLYALSHPQHAEIARQQYAGYVDAVGAMLGQDHPKGSARILAGLVVATMDGLILQFLADPRPAPAAKRLAAAISSLQAAVAADGHE